MTRRLVLLLLAAGVSGLACSKTEKPLPESAAPSVSVAEPAPPPSASAAAGQGLAEPTTKLRETEIPTEEDFENEAQERITAANLEAALDELERELAN